LRNRPIDGFGRVFQHRAGADKGLHIAIQAKSMHYKTIMGSTIGEQQTRTYKVRKGD
jgi:hypothetical protein